MRGHLRKRGQHWHIVLYMGKDENGDPEYKWHSASKILGRRATKPEAERILAEMLKELGDDTYVTPQKKNLNEFLKSWLEHIKHVVAYSTYHRYESIVNKHLIPSLGSTQISKLKPMQIQEFYTTLLAPGSRKDKREGVLSPRSVRYIHATLHKALNQAIEWRLLKVNPSDKIKLPAQKKKEMKVWDDDQVRIFLASLKEKKHRLYPLYVVAFATGMRQSELLGLRWQDINLDGKVLSVRQVLSEVNGTFDIKEPKTKKPRTITLPASAVSVLRGHKMSQSEETVKINDALTGEEQAERKSAENKKFNDLVFLSSTGTLIAKRNLLRHFENWQETLKTEPRLTFHEIRHTHATLLIKSGIHIKVVSERLGHASIRITMDTYGHVLPSLQQGAADEIENQLFKEKEPEK